MYCAAGLVLAAVIVSNSASPTALYQRSAPMSYRLSAAQRVATAQAKVARDLAALRRTEAEVIVFLAKRYLPIVDEY